MTDRRKIDRAYTKAFAARVKQARADADYKPKVLAAELGLKPDTYRKYEKDHLLPHDIVQAFCQKCDIKADWLFRVHVGAVEVPNRKANAGLWKPRARRGGSAKRSAASP